MNAKQEIGNIIRDLLSDNRKTQTELAEYLGLSQARISQILSGRNTINVTQLDQIMAFIPVEDKIVKKIYALISEAKTGIKVNPENVSLGTLHVQDFPSGEESKKIFPYRVDESTPKKPESNEAIPVKTGELASVPVISFAAAKGFDQTIEPFCDFAKDCADEEREFSKAQPGYFALQVEGDSMSPEIPNGSYLLVAAGEYPQRGDIVVAKLQESGDVVCKIYNRKNNHITLESINPSGENFSWHTKEQAGYAAWMYPVIEITLDPRRVRWEKKNHTIKYGNSSCDNGHIITRETLVAEEKADYPDKNKHSST